MLVAVFLAIMLFSVVTTYTLISAINLEDHSRPSTEIESQPIAPPTAVPQPPEAVSDPPSPPVIPLGERLRKGFAKTRDSLLTSLAGLAGGKIDSELLDRIHELLYRADVGHQAADSLVQYCRANLDKGEELSLDKIKKLLHRAVTDILDLPSETLSADKKHIILLVGVNGVGKTTTIGKLGNHFKKQKRKVLICAGDTFRAAAIDQLQVWAERLQVDFVKHKQGADPGAVVFDAVQTAKQQDNDMVLVDTAGRLHNRENLMAELAKIRKIIARQAEDYQVATWIVLDATTGQNAMQQVKIFLEMVQVSGIIVTKLDGTAKGGVLVGICEQFKIPLQFIGIGEQADDLRPFEARAVADSMLA